MDANNKNVELVNRFVDSYKGFKNEISKVIVGQENVIDQVLMSVFCDGHSLLVDPWGRVLNRAFKTPKILNTIIDLRKVKKDRNKIPSLSHD